ncbi:MAG: nitrite reductase/ring-hydroxylating ferredoxin subunit [Candidatus Paceibacteria bacterium]|jgi:nitrite reductase/ring-hydroxylating ferredoxin subunit
MTDSTTSVAADWQPTVSADSIEPGTMSVWKKDGEVLVICKTDDGEFSALDNRCPHEGYPLNSGDLKGTALTCSWHNWKFNVRSGACTLGEEGVRSYPVRVRDGLVEVDLAQPDPSETWPDLLDSFEVGLRKHQVARSARDGVRLLQAGYRPEQLLIRVALYDARHAEYGTTHATPVAADGARFLNRYQGLDAMYAIAPAVDMCGEANRLRPRRERPAPIGGEDLDSLRAAVEGEEVSRALGILRGAFDAGRTRQEIDTWMFAVLSDHFLSFGHPLIYFIKLQELLSVAGDAEAEELYEGLLFSVCNSTREDTLPYMKGYKERFQAFQAAQGPNWRATREGASEVTQPLADRVRDAALHGSTNEALDSLTQALEGGASLEQIASALVAAAAQRLLRFNLALDTNPRVAETWLWASHRLTFASAVRNAVQRFDHKLAVHFLVQAMGFVHSGRAMDLPVDEWPTPSAETMDVQAVLTAVAAQDSERAMAGTLGLLGDSSTRRELQEALEDLCLNDPLVRPIVVAHAIKTVVVAFEEFDAALNSVDRAIPILATVRMLSSPIQERRIHDAVYHSIQWVGKGIMPKKLTQ